MKLTQSLPGHRRGIEEALHIVLKRRACLDVIEVAPERTAVETDRRPVIGGPIKRCW